MARKGLIKTAARVEAARKRQLKVGRWGLIDPKARGFNVRVKVIRSGEGEYKALSCVFSKKNRYGSRCGEPRTGSTPTKAAKRALASLARKLR